MRKLFMIVLILNVANIYAQDKFLAIERPGHVKRIKFPIGTELNFKIRGDNFYSPQTIDDVYDSTLVLSGKFIHIDDVAGIKYKSESVLLENLAYKLPAFAIVLLAFSAINSTAAVDDDKVVFTDFAIVGSAGLVAVGITAHIIRSKTHRFNGRKKLKIIDTRIEVN